MVFIPDRGKTFPVSGVIFRNIDCACVLLTWHFQLPVTIRRIFLSLLNIIFNKFQQDRLINMAQTFQQEYMQMPPMTRTYTTACVLTTLAVVRV